MYLSYPPHPFLSNFQLHSEDIDYIICLIVANIPTHDYTDGTIKLRSNQLSQKILTSYTHVLHIQKKWLLSQALN